MDQRSTLPSVPHDLEILQLARQVGADEVIIAEVVVKPTPENHGFHARVTARSFSTDTKMMRWSGTALCVQPVKDPERVVLPLARIAVAFGTGLSTNTPLTQQETGICLGDHS
jgi:hypothetical protein